MKNKILIFSLLSLLFTFASIKTEAINSQKEKQESLEKKSSDNSFFVRWGKKITRKFKEVSSKPVSESKANLALAFGLVGVFLLRPVFSVIALVQGYQAMKELREFGKDYPAFRKARWGVITSWIGIGLSLLATTLIFVNIGFFL